MNPPTTDWTSAIAIGVAGLILGALFIYFFTRRNTGPTIAADLERKDLEAKRDALISQLRALPDDAVDERARLESETARVLRDLDKRGGGGGGQAILPGAGHDERRDRLSSTGMKPETRGFLWGVASSAALAALLFFVYKTATPRPEGEMATGGIGNTNAPQAQQQQPQQQPSTDPMVMQMEAAVQKDPANNEMRLNLAQMYLERDNLMGVFEQARVVLEREPRNPRALTYGALVRMAMGESDVAKSMLQQATTADPSNLDAWVAMAWLHTQTNDIKQAEAAIAAAAKASPENAGRLNDVLAQMKERVAQEKSAPQQAAMPPDHPNIGGAPAQTAAAATGDGRKIDITLQIDPAASAKSGIVFVVARPLAGGPPVAVKRMQVTSFPVSFQLTSADSMLGQPLPDKFRLEARLDSDGNATTKPPTDPSAAQPEAAVGGAVTLALK